MQSTKTSKQQNGKSVIASFRVGSALATEIKTWADKRGLTTSYPMRRALEIGWPVFLKQPMAEKTDSKA